MPTPQQRCYCRNYLQLQERVRRWHMILLVVQVVGSVYVYHSGTCVVPIRLVHGYVPIQPIQSVHLSTSTTTRTHPWNIGVPTTAVTTKLAMIRRTNNNNNVAVLLWGQKSKSGTSKNIPEFTVENTDDDDEDEFIEVESPLLAAGTSSGGMDSILGNDDDNDDFDESADEEEFRVDGEMMETLNTSPNSLSATKLKVQYAAMEPGTVVQIQVGDIALARKAWKKRRRSDSPLLVPCSILHVDRLATIRWNCIYLLEKFGTSIHLDFYTGAATTVTSTRGVRISLSELSIRHRTHLKSSLLHHATALGFNNSYELLEGLFRKQVQDAYGVRLVLNDMDASDVQTENDDANSDTARKQQKQLWLETPLSRTRAQLRSASAAMLQFCEAEAIDILQHTGLVRIKRESSTIIATTTETLDQSSNNNLYQLQPLSVALRVSSDDVDSIVQNGSRHAAVVFDYDVKGDACIAPLLTLSLNPQRNQVRDRLKNKNKIFKYGSNGNSIHRNGISISSKEHIQWFHNLHVGDGPFSGKILRLVKGGALVDCGICRERRNNNVSVDENKNECNDDEKKLLSSVDRDSCLPVFGLLRFKDAVLNDSDGDGSSQFSRETDKFVPDEEDDDESWGNIFSIDDLNRFDDEIEDEEDVNEMEEEDEEDIVDQATDDAVDDYDEEDDDVDTLDGEVLAEFNLDNDDEFAEGEDITHLFELRDDGTLEYTDPETGETKVISDVIIQDDHDDGDDEEDDEEESYNVDDDHPMLLSSFNSGGVRTDISKSSFDQKSSSNAVYKTQTLRAGDRIDVYIKSVSKQSSQLLLSMDSSVQGMTAKDLKKESEVSKKLSRLVKQLGGYKRIRELTGVECNGTIKATSNTGGDWYYVQPDIENVPVGIATILDGTLLSGDGLKLGDTVRIRLNGIDEDRGQLAIYIVD
jgi:hypothetical protein